MYKVKIPAVIGQGRDKGIDGQCCVFGILREAVIGPITEPQVTGARDDLEIFFGLNDIQCNNLAGFQERNDRAQDRRTQKQNFHDTVDYINSIVPKESRIQICE